MSELLMCVGPELADEVSRCAVAAGYSVTVGEPGRDSGEWLRSDVVVVDADAVSRFRAAGVPRRVGVLAVCAPEGASGVWQDAMALGAGDGFVLPDEEDRLVGVLSELTVPARSDGRVLAILGGHGGAGATTLAAAAGLAAVGMAAVAERGRRVLLVAPDEVGTGIDLLLGVEDHDGPRACDLAATGGRLSHAALHDALPQGCRGLSVLAAGRSSGRGVQDESVLAAVDAGRAGGDVVIIDVPRTRPSLRHGLVDRADLVVLLTRALVPALWAARATREDIGEPRGVVGLVVRGPAPSGIPVTELAWAVGAELLGSYRSDPSLPARMESEPLRPAARKPLGVIATRICDRLDEVVA